MVNIYIYGLIVCGLFVLHIFAGKIIAKFLKFLPKNYLQAQLPMVLHLPL